MKTRKKVDRGQRIEDRQNVIPAPYVIPAEAGIQKTEVRSRRSEVGKSPFAFPPFQRGEIGGDLQMKWKM